MNKPTSARVAQKREQARREILSSAQAILREQGPDAVTLASVAGRLGMTKQSLYHYFASKEALDRGLVTTLLDEEIDALLSAITALRSNKRVLGVLIKTFYAHYVDNLDAFRSIYSQSQMYSSSASKIDEVMLREEIHPRTRQLFDVLEEKLSGQNSTRSERRRAETSHSQRISRPSPERRRSSSHRGSRPVGNRRPPTRSVFGPRLPPGLRAGRCRCSASDRGRAAPHSDACW